MNTQAWIDAALEAQTDYDDAVRGSATATVKLQQARQTLTLANQALHDDLAANGPAYTLDETVTPPVLTVYQAVDPDTYSATVIRPAEAAA